MAAGSMPDSLGDEAIFAQAREAFGERGIADMILRAGSYHTV